MSYSLWPYGPQHAGLPSPSLSSRVCSNTCPLSWWCQPTISSSVTHFSSCPQFFPTSGSFPISWLFASGGQSIGASALSSVLSMKIQVWSPYCPRDSRVFSSTTVQKHQFFGTQPSLWSNSHICTWLLEKTIVLTIAYRGSYWNKPPPQSHVWKVSFLNCATGLLGSQPPRGRPFNRRSLHRGWGQCHGVWPLMLRKQGVSEGWIHIPGLVPT